MEMKNKINNNKVHIKMNNKAHVKREGKMHVTREGLVAQEQAKDDQNALIRGGCNYECNALI